jgi:hypothetical protein
METAAQQRAYGRGYGQGMMDIYAMIVDGADMEQIRTWTLNNGAKETVPDVRVTIAIGSAPCCDFMGTNDCCTNHDAH